MAMLESLLGSSDCLEQVLRIMNCSDAKRRKLKAALYGRGSFSHLAKRLVAMNMLKGEEQRQGLKAMRKVKQ